MNIYDSKIENAMHKNGDRLVGDDNGEDQLPPINIHNNMPTNEKFAERRAAVFLHEYLTGVLPDGEPPAQPRRVGTLLTATHALPVAERGTSVAPSVGVTEMRLVPVGGG